MRSLTSPQENLTSASLAALSGMAAMGPFTTSRESVWDDLSQFYGQERRRLSKSRDKMFVDCARFSCANCSE